MSNNNIPDLPQQTGFTLISSKKKKKSPISQGLESGAKRISFQDNNSPEGETQGTTETPVKAPDPQIANQQNSNSLDQVQTAFIGTPTNCYNLFEDNDDESVDGNEYQDLKDPNEYEDQAINEIQTKMMNMEDRINENISKAMDRMEQLVINAIVNNQQQQHHYNQYAYSYHQQHQSHQTYSTVARGNITVQATNNSQMNSTQDTTSNPSTTSTNECIIYLLLVWATCE